MIMMMVTMIMMTMIKMIMMIMMMKLMITITHDDDDNLDIYALSHAHERIRIRGGLIQPIQSTSREGLTGTDSVGTTRRLWRPTSVPMLKSRFLDCSVVFA